MRPLLASKMVSGFINSAAGAVRPLVLKNEFSFSQERLGFFMSAMFFGNALTGLVLGRSRHGDLHPAGMRRRRKGGWSGTNAYISTGSSREGSARPGTAPIAGRKGGGMDRGQPQQISATKPGFVSGRAVWGGTAERRANEAISKARSATNII